MTKKVALVGYGYLGQAYHKMFPDAVIYDEPKRLLTSTELLPPGLATIFQDNTYTLKANNDTQWLQDARIAVNDCDVTLVAVPTDLLPNGELDMSIIEEVVDWVETPLILIKSALHPGTTDRLVEKTGKRLAVSVEYIGEGNYPIPYWKYPHQNDPRLHQLLVVGGEESAAEEAAQILWRKMSPDIRIHKVTALEAEIVKLVENAQAALKVTFANTFLSLAQKTNTSFVRMEQAWSSDPRTESMHLRAVEFERGWKSRCWSKDVIAFVTYAKSVGATDTERLFQMVLDLNEEHLALTNG